MTRELKRAARRVVKNYAAVKQGEKVLIIVDEPLRTIGYLLWQEARKIRAEVLLVEITPEEPSPALIPLMKYMDVILVTTSKPLPHIGEASQARIISCAGITPDIMRRSVNINHRKIVERSRKLADIFTIARTANLTTPAGTDLVIPLANSRGLADTGIAHHPGDLSNLPAGEACVAPVEGKTQGVMVVDGSVGDIGLVKTPIKMIVKDGFATRIIGGEEAQIIRRLIRPFGRPARNIAELGIGTNHKAKLCGNILEDKKVLGTVHIAIGDNSLLGGKISVPVHLDCVLLKPTLIVDGRKILERGRLVG